MLRDSEVDKTIIACHFQADSLRVLVCEVPVNHARKKTLELCSLAVRA